MKKGKPPLFLPILLCLASVPAASLTAQTLRGSAEAHFNGIQWTTDPNYQLALEIPSVTLPGGNESFPALRPRGQSNVSGIYPELERIGSLDYSGVNPQTVAALNRVAESLLAGRLDPSLADADRPFVAPMANYRLSRLPAISRVFFARPTGSDGTLKVEYLLRAGSGTDAKSLFVTVEFGGSSPLVRDIIFDSVSYARIAEQN